MEVVEVLGGNATRPASHRVSTHWGGASVEYLDADVWLEPGRFQTAYRLRDRLWYLGALLFAHHAPGTYRIRAFYREFTTPPILIVVK